MSKEQNMHPVVFFRNEGFYPIEFLAPDECGMSLAVQAADHAKLNPGTLRIEDAVTGETLWEQPQ